MVSLTAFLEHLPGFGLSVPALYERQRALIRLGHLPAPKGRGRGAGVEATPQSVGILITALMATDNLSEIDGRVKRLANAKFNPTKEGQVRCELTGAAHFSEAVEHALAKPQVADRIEQIIVSRSNLSAHVYWQKRPKQRHLHTLFGPEMHRNFDVSAYLDGDMLRYVGKLLRET